MSIGAYKLIEIKTEKSPTFSRPYDDRVMGIAEESETGDIIRIQKNAAQEELASILAEIKKASDGGEAEDLREVATIFRQIIKDCGDESYCDYYCF